ncbi:hypothetical protein MELA_01143 [Candidatus Methylomirabilis lanthanidiphila]|uniref:Methyltransferase type 11 domain-containing protein n=1 Tax=Candidatus Methylomirabilis lanthanidiphila TaxID=2211376 RepID=A0A564ZHH1_9BACT|nr:class I SAM-dependent methyltransferase [Candidatus Methylomirabilis lanthanidiphila]VUZ84769.1 hypothetical protein MELA_01143 [Candidatus Methylomirabilis lanthanidiphila]
MPVNKAIRFAWRATRNVLCLVPVARQILFPRDRLAARFGRGDAEYAWSVFARHFTRLRDAGFSGAELMLEVGPGRNLGTALLWWAYCGARRDDHVGVVCWDVFKNGIPETRDFWGNLAQELLDAPHTEGSGLQESELDQVLARLREVATGRLIPRITYRVEPLTEFEDAMAANGVQFDLIYSQAAIEHIWRIEAFWDAMGRLTAPGGWHSHRIDLADHGRRDTNYIAMLEWSSPVYWLTMRFIPGATNRWRAHQHLSKLEGLGMEILVARRELRERPPIPRSRLSGEFRSLPEQELRAASLDVVAMAPFDKC